MVHHQFRLATTIRLRRSDFVGSSKTFASRTTHDRRAVGHLSRLKHLAELFQMFFARGAVRIRANVQRYIQINETPSDASETGPVQLSPHRTSDSLKRVSPSMGFGRL